MPYLGDRPDNALLVIDVATPEIVGKTTLEKSPERVSVPPDGKTIAAASEIGNSMTFISANTGKKLSRSRPSLLASIAVCLRLQRLGKGTGSR